MTATYWLIRRDWMSYWLLWIEGIFWRLSAFGKFYGLYCSCSIAYSIVPEWLVNLPFDSACCCGLLCVGLVSWFGLLVWPALSCVVTYVAWLWSVLRMLVIHNLKLDIGQVTKSIAWQNDQQMTKGWPEDHRMTKQDGQWSPLTLIDWPTCLLSLVTTACS